MTKKSLVIANGEIPSAQLLHSLNNKHSQLVAVDGGLYACLKYGLEPQLIIGDFDSISKDIRKKFSHVPQICTLDQDKTDLEKALTWLFETGSQQITVCGAIGKRLDHTLTNICLLCRYPECVTLETDTEICFALSRSNTLTCQPGQTLSLIPLSFVRQVFTNGLKWEIHGKDLNKNFISISNICRKNTISISFEEGDMVVCMMRPFTKKN